MTTKTNVPYHSLGISQIIAFGALFYAFAQLKTPLAQNAGVSEAEVLYAVSASLFMQTLLAPAVGSLIDRFGALFILSRGLVIGAAGMLLLPLFPSIIWIWFCMLPIGIGFVMSSYETAFSAAVQIDESRARRNISYITFYGGVASSLTWLAIAPLLLHVGLFATCMIIAVIMVLMAWRANYLSTLGLEETTQTRAEQQTSFTWTGMTRNERFAIIILAASSSFEYLLFAGTSLLWINWFYQLFGDLSLAVILASIYGPFQVVGRVIEMKFGSKIDARITGMTAFSLVPFSLIIVQIPHLWASVLAMALFGMGHGILTVTFGYVTNLYFKAEVYGRAKGWIVMPRGIANAMGPTIGGLLFVSGQMSFFGVMFFLGLLAWACFSMLLFVKTRSHTQVS